MKPLLFVLILYCAVAFSHVLPKDDLELKVKRLGKQKVFKMVRDLANKPENLKMSCLACTMIVDGMQTLLKNNATVTEVEDFVIEACEFLNIDQPYVCKHMIETNQDEVVFVLERTVFTPDEICGMFVKNCGHAENPMNDMWNLTIPGNKPPIRPWPKIPDGKPTYRVLHLSDIHVDRKYAVGSEAYCQMDNLWGTYSMCCRNYPDADASGHADRNKPIYVPAGRWGMPYGCDIPFETFISAMKHISKTHTDLDYIIVTGDFEAHDNFDYTQEATTTNIENITDVLLKYFPTTPIYITIGNHEGVPQDAMAPHTMPEYEQRGPQWLYTSFKGMVSHWIPTSALPDVQYRASYVVYPKPGLKLISINTVYCAVYNYYLYIDQYDPDATLEWLIEQLMDSESKGELVHIISHIPPGDDYCLKGWSHNYYEIIKRFENTIAQQFYGHTHYDHFQVYYDTAHPNSRPFHFNWISPSLTTFEWLNPAYRIYTIDGGYDGATYTVKDAETYSTDLLVANQKNQEPVFTLEYNYREFYGMPDLSPQSFADLSDRLWTDHELFRKYVKLYWRNNYDNECYQDTECRKGYICELKRSRSHDDSFCQDLK